MRRCCSYSHLACHTQPQRPGPDRWTVCAVSLLCDVQTTRTTERQEAKQIRVAVGMCSEPSCTHQQRASSSVPAKRLPRIHAWNIVSICVKSARQHQNTSVQAQQHGHQRVWLARQRARCSKKCSETRLVCTHCVTATHGHNRRAHLDQWCQQTPVGTSTEFGRAQRV